MSKAVDCIQLKRDGARALMDKLAVLTPEERHAYWDQRSREFAAEVHEAKAARAAAGLPQYEPDVGGLAPSAEPAKSFDCVEMKHRAQAALEAFLSEMTAEEQTQWWTQRSRELRERQAQLIAEAAAPEDATNPS